MSGAKAALVVGGTSGIGLEIARALAARGERVTITGRDPARTDRVAKSIGYQVSAAALDLSEPQAVVAALEPMGPIDHVVISAIERDYNSVRDYDIRKALRLATLKLVGYTAVVHALSAKFPPTAAVVLVGGLAKERPYPGSTTVSAVNGGVVGLVHTLACELGPVRVNGLHPGIIGDTDAWRDRDEVLEAVRGRTPGGRLASTEDVAGAALFLLDNRGVNGVNLNVDGGWLLK